MTKKMKKQKQHKGHNPQAESVKACFGEPKAKGDEYIPRTFK